MRFDLNDCKNRPEEVISAIRKMDVGEVRLMEVCGTHTMAIARSGIKKVLPENIHLLSGPGCPVCVTPPELIDGILKLADRPDVMIATYGDMVRVPGSVRGENLAKKKSLGSRVEIVYSPMDAVELAKQHPETQVVFLGVGFETTAPGTAAAVLAAREAELENFSVFPLLKTVEPVLRALIADPEFNVQGFLCPGHVAVIIGEDGLRFLPEEFGIPAVIGGFEPEDLLLSIWMLLKQIEEKNPRMENEYTRAVAPEGNPLAAAVMNRVLRPDADIWRGLGEIPQSALTLREEYAKFDARKRFSITYTPAEDTGGCRCGDVIQGKLSPASCPLFGRACTPEDPFGPCMVSSEGTCAAAFKYREV